MGKLVTALIIASLVVWMAGQALALNPQPLPPRQHPIYLVHGVR